MQNIFGAGRSPDANKDSMDIGSGSKHSADSELTKEEMRRRRLATLQDTVGSPPSRMTTDSESMSSSDVVVNLDSATFTPVRSITEPIISSAEMMPTFARGSSAPTSSQKMNLNAIALNTLLEYALHASMRDPSQRHLDSDKTLIYINPGSDSDMINSSNVSEVICNILVDKDLSDVGGAVGYLVACYRRLVSKEGALASEKIREDYNSCKKQIISLIVTSISEPDMFGHNSADSIQSLYKLLRSEDVGAVSINIILRDVVEELSQQGIMIDVMRKLIDIAYTSLTMPLRPGTLRSMLDDTSGVVNSIMTLARLDKRVGAAFIECSNFLLPKNLVDANPQNVPQFMLQNPSLVEQYTVKGASIPHATLLGVILRGYPNAFDPAIMGMFQEAHRSTRAAYDNNVNSLRKILQTNQQAASEIILALLKCGGNVKDATMRWLSDAISLNREAEKGQPSPLLAASSGFLRNLGAVTLILCRPIMSDIEKIKKIEWEYIVSEEGSIIFPTDITKLYLPENEAKEVKLSNSNKFNFITQSFFICWRALHLGFVKLFDGYYNQLRWFDHVREGLERNEPRAIHSMVSKIVSDVMLFDPIVMTDLLQFCITASQSFMLLFNDQNIHNERDSWLISSHMIHPNQKRILEMLPEHLIDDILTILLTIARVEPNHLNTVSLDPVLSLIIFFLRRPWAVKSPHLRALFGLILFQVFLPVDQRSQGDYWSHQTHLKDGPHSNLLSSHSDCQKYLAPALLLLYGDVEKTGYYDKLSNRRCIMIVLKHLWTLPTHRSAFRGIVNSYDDDASSETATANSSSDGSIDISKNYFIRFANGMMNEANSLVSTTMEKLAEIRKGQLHMASVEWHQLTEEARNEFKEKHDANERECRGCAGLCLETINMLNYLTSDEVIRGPFLENESILTRFIDTLLSVLFKLVGPKSLEIKVDNMDSYNFQPKVMLKEIAMALLNFADIPQFQEAVGTNSFYKNEEEFRKAIATIHKLRLLQPSEEYKLQQLVEAVGKMKDFIEALKALESEAPDEFLDPLVFSLMKDPVLLPTSNLITDRSTIAQQLLNNEIDPFNRQPLKMSMVIPQPDLKRRINEWVESKLPGKI